MFLIYVDESGSNSWSKPEDIFVLASVIIHDGVWSNIDEEISQFKKDVMKTQGMNIKPDAWELHASDIMDGRGLFKRFKSHERFKLIHDAYKFIGSLTFTINSVAVFKHHLWKKIDVEEWGFKLLYERLNKYLGKVSWITKKEENGLVLIDSIGSKFDQKRSDLFYRFMKNGTKYYTGNNFVVERPVFVKSQYRNLSQLADMIAYGIRRTLLGKPYFDKYFNWFKPKFDTSMTGEILGYGLKIFPDEAIPHARKILNW